MSIVSWYTKHCKRLKTPQNVKYLEIDTEGTWGRQSSVESIKSTRLVINPSRHKVTSIEITTIVCIPLLQINRRLCKTTKFWNIFRHADPLSNFLSTVLRRHNLLNFWLHGSDYILNNLSFTFRFAWLTQKYRIHLTSNSV